MPELTRTEIRIAADVRDVKDNVLPDAEVAVRTDGDKVGLEYDAASGLYVGTVKAGAAEVVVSHPRLEGQKRTVRVGAGRTPELFILGEEGVPTYFRERVRVPVDADRDLVAVTLTRARRDDTDEIDSFCAQIGLEEVQVPELAQRSGMRLYRSGDVAAAVEELRQHPAVEHVGAVVKMGETTFSHLTNDIVVQFQGPRKDEVPSIAREYGCTVERELVFAPSTYVLRWERGATLEILEVIERLAARDDVAWAEPSLVVAPELDAISPADTLWPGLWDRQLIGTPDAWQALQNAGLDTFGDPDIVLAVWDSGTQSSGGVPTNADFSGTVSDGNPKVLASYDFETMVANNDSPWDPHGSGVAGVSAALANNPTPANAIGVVGSAPNVRIMTVAGRWPYIDIEVGDQYLWMAGFDPQSPIPGFPAPPPRGADVITCSLTPGAGAPLSGTARATLDFVTTFGRGGKGTMCFFSTGNANANNVTARPYGAYEKCFAIAATSIDDDGVTEIRAPYSGWGQIAFCAPSQDAAGTVHNPPTGYKPWSAAHAGAGNMISTVTQQTTLSAATAAGATTLAVASVAGFASGSVIHVGAIGAVGSEPALVTSVNAGANELTVNGYTGSVFSGGLLNAHTGGDVVLTGPANHSNSFGGTSSATPLCAGVGALVLSANPSLTYIEAREIMRNTAVKLDLGNTTANGQWLDANGDPSVTSGLPPVRSGWYGYGRIDAAAAVTEALTFGTARDLVIRDNLADTGTVATVGAFWNSPDIWCRRDDPAGDPGALPPNYATAGPHEAPERGQTNWVYARVRNNGTQVSLDAWVRVSVTHWPGTEFTYPASFQPTNGPGDPLPSPLTPGTYFIGEAKVTDVAPGAEEIVTIEWPAGLIPPDTVMTSTGPVTWHPCLLAEITPHDGPVPTGDHVWDDNNLAQKNISIVDTDAGTDFATALVLGNLHNEADCLYLEVHRGRLPRGVQLYVDLRDPVLRRRIRDCDPVEGPRGRHQGPIVKFHPWRCGWRKAGEVIYLQPMPRVRVPLCGGAGRLSLVVLGGIVGEEVDRGEYEVVLLQRQPSGEISGSATVMVRVGKERR